jgi:hypothetical protein
MRGLGVVISGEIQKKSSIPLLGRDFLGIIYLTHFI